MNGDSPRALRRVRSCTRVAAFALLGAVMTTSLRARGETSSREADRLFQVGRQALADDNYELARTSFEQSYALDPALGTLLNLAVCEEKLGKLRSALAHLQRAFELAETSDRRRPLIDQRLARIDARLPRLTVRASNTIDPGVKMTLDANRLGVENLGKVMRVDPGNHVLDCEGPHGERCTRVFTLSEGENAVHDITVSERLPEAPPPPVVAPRPGSAAVAIPVQSAPLPPPASSSDGRSLAYAVGGFGLASVVVGLVAGGAVIRQKALVEQRCDSSGCDEVGMSAAADGRSFSMISNIATVLGVVGLGTSAYLFFSVPSSPPSTVGWSVAGSF